MNPTEPNNTNSEELAANTLTPLQKRRLMEQYQKLLSLIPTGKHKGQRGTKGAFGNRKRLTRK